MDVTIITNARCELTAQEFHWTKYGADYYAYAYTNTKPRIIYAQLKDKKINGFFSTRLNRVVREFTDIANLLEFLDSIPNRSCITKFESRL